MKNNILKHILFSLILLFGIYFYSDEVYAKSPFVDSGAGCPKSSPACKNKSYIPDKITCTYKPIKRYKRENNKNKSVSVKDISKFTLDFKLEMMDRSDRDALNYEIVAYYDGVKLDNFKPEKYEYSYDCPKSIAYYGEFNNNSDVYASTLKKGNDIWLNKLDDNGDIVTMYTLEKGSSASDAYKITPVKDCEFVSSTTGTKAKFKVGFDMDGINTDIISLSFYLSTDGGSYQKVKVSEYKNHAEIYNAITSGDCNDNTLKFMYRRNDNVLYFSELNDIITTEDPNDLLDGDDQDYTLYRNINLDSILKNAANEALSKTKNCDDLMKKNCNGTDDDSEKCRKAKEECYAAQTLYNSNCSGVNKSLMNSEQKKKCDEANQILQKYYDSGYSFNVIIEVEVTCETLGKLRDKLQTYFNLIKYLTPVLIIGLSVVDFVQATGASDDDALKKAKDKFVKRLVIGVIIFLLPYLIDIILQLIEDYYPSSTCGIK